MQAARPILIVSADAVLCETIASRLPTDRLKPIAISSLSEAKKWLSDDANRVDLIILDFDLTDQESASICADIREARIAAPIIGIGQSNDEADVVTALSGGAADYVAKPLRMDEILARIEAQLRLFDLSELATFSIGRYSFRPSTKTLTDAKRRIRLTGKEVEILKFFYRRPNVEVSRQTLLDEVWGYHSGVDSHTLETHLYRLRQKIEDDPNNRQLLVTVVGGYRLNIAGN